MKRETNFSINENPLRPQYEKLTSRRDILTTKLSNLQLKVWHNWQQTIDERIAKDLKAKVMTLMIYPPVNLQLFPNAEAENKDDGDDKKRNDKSNDIATTNSNTWQTKFNLHEKQSCHTVMPPAAAATRSSATKTASVSDIKKLQMNFSIELFTLLKETKYLLALQQIHNRQELPGDAAMMTMMPATAASPPPYQLPQTLLDLYAQRDILWQRKIKLMKISEYYNSIRSESENSHCHSEMQLVEKEIQHIDEQLAYASDTLTWHEYGK